MDKIAQIDFDQIRLHAFPNQIIAPGQSPGGWWSMGFIFFQLIPYIFMFSGIGLLIYLLSGGFKIMTSAGDPKKVQEGQTIITNAVIGFVVIFVAYWVVQIVGSLLGLESVLEIFSNP